MTNVGPLSLEQLARRIREFPEVISDLTRGMNDETLELPTREGGWTIRQIVHHIADSHVRIYCNMRFVLTEENTTIKPYRYNDWAELGDAKYGDIADSLMLIEAIHKRSAQLLESVTDEHLQKTAFHPEVGEVTLEYFARALVFHGQHHLRKVHEALQRAEAERHRKQEQ